TNFLFDKSQTPHMRAAELAKKFGLSQSTAGNKASEIYRLLKMTSFDPEWTLPSKLGDNPLVWMFETKSGFIFDARYASREIQEELFNAGMIPFIPADFEETAPPQDEDKSESMNTDHTKKKREQHLIEGQITFNDF
ncbi:MAG: DUF6398 domain-containing protein, partial [Defluviitaleaceae bacterium]|nr:DUF6398 domain-containing protein [Defluviitaleaceae bacterium]